MTRLDEAERSAGRPAREIGPWGTMTRLVVGAAAVALALDIGVSWLDASIGLLVLPAALTVLLGLRGRSASPLRLDGPEGPPLFTMTWVVGIALGIAVPEALFLALGASMLLGAARGDAGCEVTAIPNWVLRREDQIFCCLFTPVDELEAQIRNGDVEPRSIRPPAALLAGGVDGASDPSQAHARPLEDYAVRDVRMLSDRGLGPMLEKLAGRSPVPIWLNVDLPRRPGTSVEEAAFLSVSESLANMIEHSQATEAHVTVRLAQDGWVTIQVRDDGIDGADPAGPGLSGLRERVRALDGEVQMLSPAGGPTVLMVELPSERDPAKRRNGGPVPDAERAKRAGHATIGARSLGRPSTHGTRCCG